MTPANAAPLSWEECLQDWGRPGEPLWSEGFVTSSSPCAQEPRCPGSRRLRTRGSPAACARSEAWVAPDLASVVVSGSRSRRRSRWSPAATARRPSGLTGLRTVWDVSRANSHAGRVCVAFLHDEGVIRSASSSMVWALTHSPCPNCAHTKPIQTLLTSSRGRGNRVATGLRWAEEGRAPTSWGTGTDTNYAAMTADDAITCCTSLSRRCPWWRRW